MSRNRKKLRPSRPELTETTVQNHLQLSGRISERKAIRHTPAGVMVSEFRLVHESEQLEAGKLRKVVAEVACVLLGDEARWFDALPLGSELKLTGFLAARSQHGRALVLHVTAIEQQEGIRHEENVCQA